MESPQSIEIDGNTTKPSSERSSGSLGLVLSGGGSRAAYQIGALRAVNEKLANSQLSPNVIVGTSVGAINSIVFAACLKLGASQAIDLITDVWQKRTYKNTFDGSIPRSFFKAVQIAILRYSLPGPQASSISIFDPNPLKREINDLLHQVGGIQSIDHASRLQAVAVMTTIEGAQRKPLLLAQVQEDLSLKMMAGASFEFIKVERLRASHGLASSALPSVLPAVDLDLDTKTVRLVDGGICDNVPVDPAVRLGAKDIILIDSSGRRWWFDHYEEPHDTRPSWEIPADHQTFCMCPERFIECRNMEGLGSLLKQAVGKSSRSFIQSLGPTWPIFKILKHKMGEELAYEVMSYVALAPQYTEALLEQGYNETCSRLEGVSLSQEESAEINLD